MAKVFAEGYADAEATLVTKDGDTIPFYFTGVRLMLDGKTYVAGMGIDITRRKEAEEAHSQERDALPDALPKRQ